MARVKTLHPMIHGGILAVRDNVDHAAAMDEHAIAPIDLVVVNLYPFEATIAKEGATRDECVEQIDIGGPSMVRSAAKNHRSWRSSPSRIEYPELLAELQDNEGGLTDAGRRRLAQVFARPRPTTRDRRWLPQSRPGGGRGSERTRALQRSPARRCSTCATARTRTRRPLSTARRAGAPSPAPRRGGAERQGALLQQPRRPGRGPRPRVGVLRALRRRHQAHQSVRSRRRRDDLRGARERLVGGSDLAAFGSASGVHPGPWTSRARPSSWRATASSRRSSPPSSTTRSSC